MTRPQKAILVLAGALVLLLGVGVLLYDRYDIVSSNMAPTLEPGDEIFVRSGTAPERNDVVLFAIPATVSGQRGNLVSRVVALGGQQIEFVEGEVLIDDVRVDEPFVNESASTEPRSEMPGCAQQTPSADRCVVPDGAVFVMGDNRRGSSDSRVFGPVPADSVEGIVKDPPFWLPVYLIPG